MNSVIKIITIDVTQADIDAAISAASSTSYNLIRCCPVAQAIRRIFPNQRVSVMVTDLQIGNTRYKEIKPFFRKSRMSAFTMHNPTKWQHLRPGSFETTEVLS